MDFPDRVGVMILGECTFFPEALVPLYIFEPRYRAMLEESLETSRMFCLAMQRPDSNRECPCLISGLGLIRASNRNEDGTSNLVLQGLARIRLGKVAHLKPYRAHYFEVMESQPAEETVVAGLVERLLDLVDARLHQGSVKVPLAMMNLLSGLCPGRESLTAADCIDALRRISNPGTLADMVTMLLFPHPQIRQFILETNQVDLRLSHLVHLLTGEVARLQKKSAS